MKLCKDCKNICKCEYVWPSKPCEKWEPGLNEKFYLFGYIDGFNAGVKGYEQKLSEAHARLSEVEDWLSEHKNETQEREKEMNSTTDNKPRDYIFFYKYDKGKSIINDASSFKDAVYKLCEKEGITEIPLGDVFKKALIGFNDDDIDEIVSLHSRFSSYRIDSVFLIDKQVYGCEKE